MKVLITGGLGFIGTNLSLFLRKRGYLLKLIDNASKDGAMKNYDLLLKNGIPQIHICDIRRYNDIKAQIKDVEIVVHLAASSSTSRSIENPLADFEVNALGTLNVLDVAAKEGIPVIYTSTCKVYSARAVNDSSGYINENVSVVEGARAPYGSSKLVGELYCQEFGELFNCPIVVNRLSSVFGLYQYGTEEAGWIYWFCEAVHRDHSITIYGDGNQVRDPLWVEDLCSLIESEINNINVYAGKTLNVGGGKENRVSLLDVISYLEKKSGKKANLKYRKARPADLNIYISDMTRLFEISDWRPKTSVFEGIDRIWSFISDCG
jgi:CDP-paratose 2-epimerase